MKTVSLKDYLLEMFESDKENLEVEIASDSESPEGGEDVVLTPRDESVLVQLKTGIEKAIDQSIDEDIPANSISESSNQGGFQYESTVISAIRKAGLTGKITSGAGANAAAADADIKIGGQIFNIEVKLNNNAQMGGSSVRFGREGVTLVKEMERDTEELLKAAIANEATALNRFISFIANRTPKAINRKTSGFPMSCTKEAWDAAASKKLLVNVKIKHSADFIAKHYAKKGIFYIQIGGSGLFYLAGNPANLPIPKLSGDINIEIRSARSGAKTLASGIEVVGGGIRVQARLKASGKSPYTADDPASLLQMIQDMKKKSPTSPSTSGTRKKTAKR